MIRLSFCDFVKKLQVTLTPGQLAYCRVAFDGWNVEDAGPIAVEIFGGALAIPSHARDVVCEVAGARGGKTYLHALRLLHLALSLDLSRLAPGEQAYAPVVAPRKELSSQAVRYAKGAMLKGGLGSLIVGKPTDEEFTIQREGHVVVFQAIAASAGGVSGRGKTLVGAFLDECAFFRDESYQVNDAEIFNALSPRVIDGGQMLVGSTPWGETGLLFDLWKENYAQPKRCLVAHATTERMRRDGPSWSKVQNEIEAQRERDPENAKREFDAEFMSGAAGTFFDPQAIDAAVRPDVVLLDPKPGAMVVAGADFGFKHDSSALAIWQHYGGQTHLSRLLELRPAKGAPLKPSEVVKAFAIEMKRFHVRGVMADGYHRESLQEHLAENGISLISAPEGQAGKTLTYNRAKETIYEGRCCIPQHDRLVRQFKEIVAKPTSAGGMSIQSPRWKSGGHGDLVSAAVLGLYQLYGQKYAEKREETLEEKIRREWMKEHVQTGRKNPHWKSWKLPKVGGSSWN